MTAGRPRSSGVVPWIVMAMILFAFTVSQFGSCTERRSKRSTVRELTAIDAELAVLVRSETVELYSRIRGTVWSVGRASYRSNSLVVSPTTLAFRDGLDGQTVVIVSRTDGHTVKRVDLTPFFRGKPDRQADKVARGDGVHAFEVLNGRHGGTVVALDLTTGEVSWQHGFIAGITYAEYDTGALDLEFVDGSRLRLSAASGETLVETSGGPRSFSGPVLPDHDGERVLRWTPTEVLTFKHWELRVRDRVTGVVRHQIRVPASRDATLPTRTNVGGDVLWVDYPASFRIFDASTLARR